MKYLFFIILFVFSSLFVSSQVSRRDNLNDSIPINPNVKKEILPNGFTYYMSHNSSRPGRIFVRLDVKAGMLQQEENQPDGAHAMEHIVMRSSLHFTEGSNIKKYLKTAGITSYNAHPSDELTFYVFDIPADTMVLSNLCLAFQDWLSGQATITEATVSAERQIVAAEFTQRGQVDYMDRAGQLLTPSRFSDVFKAAASPGFGDKILTLSPMALQQFYKNWYSPNRAALIVVGDMDATAVERIIQKNFAGLQRPASQPPYVHYPFELTSNNKYIIDLRPDGNNKVISMEMFYLKNRHSKATYADYKEAALIELFNGMLHRRLNDLYPDNWKTMRSVAGGIGDGIYALNSLMVRSFQFSIRCESEKFIESSLKAMFTENERVRRYGFNKQELNDARSELLSKASVDAEDLPTEAERYSDHFIYQEAVPAASVRRQLRQKFLSKITLQEINQTVQSWFTTPNRHIVIVAPRSSASSLPSEATTLSWLKEIQQAALPHYQISKKVEPKEVKVHFDSLYSLPSSSSYTRAEFKEFAITQLKLANGVKVIIKPTVSPSDSSVYVQGLRPVGALSYGSDNYFSARYAPLLVSEAGLGELSKKDLSTYIQKHDIRLSAEISNTESSVRGTGEDKELETLLQLFYRYFLRPLKDTAAYNVKMEELIQYANTNEYINNEMTALMGYPVESHHIAEGLSTHELNQIKYDQCLEMYESCFSTLGEFTFVITGVHDMEKTIALAAKYLGHLPERKGTLLTITRNCNKPSFDIHKTIINRSSTKESAQVSLFYTGDYSYSVREKMKRELLAKILETTCFQRLREKEAGTYSLRSNLHITPTHNQQGHYEFKIIFQCDPDLSEKLIQAADEEIENIKRKGPEVADFNLAIQKYKKEQLLSNFNDDMWRDQLLDFAKNEAGFSELSDWDKQIESIQPEEIRQAAQVYLKQEGFISYIELPKNAKASDLKSSSSQ